MRLLIVESQALEDRKVALRTSLEFIRDQWDRAQDGVYRLTTVLTQGDFECTAFDPHRLTKDVRRHLETYDLGYGLIECFRNGWSEGSESAFSIEFTTKRTR